MNIYCFRLLGEAEALFPPSLGLASFDSPVQNIPLSPEKSIYDYGHKILITNLAKLEIWATRLLCFLAVENLLCVKLRAFPILCSSSSEILCSRSALLARSREGIFPHLLSMSSFQSVTCTRVFFLETSKTTIQACQTTGSSPVTIFQKDIKLLMINFVDLIED